MSTVESSFAIVAEPNRRAILSLLLSSERSVGEIERELRLSQPSVSKHLRVLREAGFVESRIEAQRRLYRLRPEPLMELEAWLVPFRRFWSKHLGTVGTAKLSTVGAPTPHVSETQVKRADAPKVLEFSWGGQDIRWELEPLGGGGTRLTLWHNIDRGFISMGAAGWHICFDVLERLLAGRPIGRIVGAEAMKFGGWQRLNAEYAKQFGVETPGWPSRPRT